MLSSHPPLITFLFASLSIIQPWAEINYNSIAASLTLNQEIQTGTTAHKTLRLSVINRVEEENKHQGGHFFVDSGGHKVQDGGRLISQLI